MKAVAYHNYGPPEVLKLVDLSKPTPRKSEVLLRVHATTVTIGDTIMRSFNLPAVSGLQKLFSRLYLGWNKPRRPVLGMEIAGTIEAVGSKVTRFEVGQAVFASTFSIGFGGYAETICFPEKGVIALKPENLTFEEAAAAPGAGMTALNCLQKADIQPGQNVLIYGASGAVGTNAVQLARHHYQAEVTGVCSTRNLAMVGGLGASQVLDYTKPGFTLEAGAYDVVFDAVGKLSTTLAKQALKQGGIFLNVLKDSDGGDSLQLLLALKRIIEAGQLKPVIDRVYPFDQIVEAHRYVEQGHKKGNVAIKVIEN